MMSKKTIKRNIKTAPKLISKMVRLHYDFKCPLRIFKKKTFLKKNRQIEIMIHNKNVMKKSTSETQNILSECFHIPLLLVVFSTMRWKIFL